MRVIWDAPGPDSDVPVPAVPFVKRSFATCLSITLSVDTIEYKDAHNLKEKGSF